MAGIVLPADIVLQKATDVCKTLKATPGDPSSAQAETVRQTAALAMKIESGPKIVSLTVAEARLIGFDFELG